MVIFHGELLNNQMVTIIHVKCQPRIHQPKEVDSGGTI